MGQLMERIRYWCWLTAVESTHITYSKLHTAKLLEKKCLIRVKVVNPVSTIAAVYHLTISCAGASGFTVGPNPVKTVNTSRL
jgi:hypothetical protein